MSQPEAGGGERIWSSSGDGTKKWSGGLTAAGALGVIATVEAASNGQ
jgi:hypothetical protein